MSDSFVGRHQELSLLHEALAEAQERRGRCVLVAGEAGIGKSRLVDEFALRAGAQGALVTWGRCWERGGAPAYWPWTEALRGIVAQRNLEDASELSQLLPELNRTSIEAAAEHADAARFRLFDAVVRFLRDMSVEQPVVIVIEDLHAADEPSLLLLESVVLSLTGLRVLVVATYRDFAVAARSPFAQALSELLRARATTRSVLVGLSAADVGNVLEATTGLSASREIVERVRDYTEGNPLYVREVARLLAAEGRLPEIGDRLAVPRDVREALLLRIRLLPGECGDVLTLAAVIGRDFALDLLVWMRGSEGAAWLEPAMQAALVVAREPSGLRFSHAVVSEALYDATSPSLLRRLHLETAEAMEKLYASNPDLHLASIAHHYMRAMPIAPAAKAVEAARRAAQGAVSRLAYEEGVRLYAMALDAAEEIDDPRLYVELLMGLGDAQGRAGYTVASKAAFLDAAARLRDSGDADLFAQAALGYAGRFVWMRAADDTRIVPLLKEALDRLPRNDSVQRVRVLARLAGATRGEVSREPRDALSREAVEIADRLGDPDVHVYALASRFCAIWGPDTSDELRTIARSAISIAEHLAERERLGEALWIGLLAHVTVGEMDTVREIAARYRRLGEDISQPSILWYATVMQGIVLLMEGRLEQVEEVIDAALERGRHAQAWDSEASHLLALAMLRWEQGRLAEMEDDIRNALSRFSSYRVFRCFLAVCFIETRRTDQAVALLKELLAGGEETLPYNNDWLAAMTILADVAYHARVADVGAAMYDALQPYGHLVGAAGGEPVTGSIQRPLGQLAMLLSDLDAARAHHERALEVHTRMRAELWIAHSEVDLADVLCLSADASAAARAEHLYARALRRAQTLGLASVEARVHAAHGSQGRPGGLTKREVEVAALIASGASNREIANTLVISERTAETHVQNILTKLGFAARSQIAAWATTEGVANGT